ncbi:4-aminobutyrate aminotransferase GabT [Nitrincola nitratireducens]|uniref:4-aminobutyrate aminotransferase GabT n=1 Tax=Nitrincola nitratireducens TaxID=1229521 RepID=W9V8S6_9GAMM|nr:4-aminobutyrate aminotransferase GabT [Nitrincola nitratireducens]
MYHLPFPSPDSDVDADQALLALERLFEVEISSEDVACIIVEPVQGEGGFRRLCPQFAQRLQSICKDLGILLIIDEIQSGFGRTGRRFAFSQLNIEPDLLLIGKSIAAGLPLAAVVGRPELMNALTKGGLGGTYSGNALACAAASQVMKLMTEDQLRTWGIQQEEMILDFHAALKATHLYPMLGPLTGIGCMRGIVFESTPDVTGAEHLAKLLVFAREEGVLLMPSGRHKNILRLLPPLTTEAEILQEGLACIERALRKL